MKSKLKAWWSELEGESLICNKSCKTRKTGTFRSDGRYAKKISRADQGEICKSPKSYILTNHAFNKYCNLL